MLSRADKIRVMDEVRKQDRITPLLPDSIDEMEARKNDLDFRLVLVKQSMKKGEILPYPFEQSLILLVKAERYFEAIEVARYVERWCADAEQRWDGRSGKVWLSPKLQKMITRIPTLEAKRLKRSR